MPIGGSRASRVAVSVSRGGQRLALEVPAAVAALAMAFDPQGAAQGMDLQIQAAARRRRPAPPGNRPAAAGARAPMRHSTRSAAAGVLWRQIAPGLRRGPGHVPAARLGPSVFEGCAGGGQCTRRARSTCPGPGARRPGRGRSPGVPPARDELTRGGADAREPMPAPAPRVAAGCGAFPAGPRPSAASPFQSVPDASTATTAASAGTASSSQRAGRVARAVATATTAAARGRSQRRAFMSGPHWRLRRRS